MSLFIPGMHWEVHGKIIEFDIASQTGKVQLIGTYGRNADGSPDLLPVENYPAYLSNSEVFSVKRKLEYLEPKVSYSPGEWVTVLGVPSGPTGDENPHDLWAGIPHKAYAQKYFIIGSLKFQPAPEFLDHEVGATMGGAPTSFPPLPYTPLPHEDPTKGTT